MPVYRLPEVDGFESREDGFGHLLVAENAILFSTKLVGPQVIKWLVDTLNAKYDGLFLIDGRPFRYFAQTFNFRRVLKLSECCPLLGAAYLNSTKSKDVLYFTLKDDLEREWRASITLGALISGNWMVGALRSLFPILLSGKLMPEPISFDTGMRAITTSFGDLSLRLPAHWDVEIAGDVIKFYIPEVKGDKLLVGGLGVGSLMDYRGRPEDYGWDGEEGSNVGEDEVVFWRALKRVDVNGVERDIVAVLRARVFNPSLVNKLKNVCEIIWKSVYFGQTWPHVTLGLLTGPSDSVSPSSSEVRVSSKPVKPVRSVSKPVSPKPVSSSTGAKFDPFKPSPFMSTIGKVLSTPWGSNQQVKPGSTSRATGSTKASGRSDVSRYNWANSSTFYVDQDGKVRSSDYNDELAADEIGSDGTLYKDGRVVGRVSEGYVYDTQGNLVGRLDTSISDRWQLETYDEKVNRDVFGSGWSLDEDEVRETSSPFVSSYGRDEDDEG